LNHIQLSYLKFVFFVREVVAPLLNFDQV
jgi:hypothetical protein